MITSLDNKRVKEYTKLHIKKYRTDSFLLLDEGLVIKANEEGYLKTLIYTGNKPFECKDELEVSQEVLDKIAKTEGLKFIGVSSFIKDKKDYQSRVMILDHLQDPLNIGRIMESAYIFGFDSIILSEESADIYNEKCLKASKGSIYKLNIYHANILEEIKELKDKGFKVYATGLKDNTKELYEVEKQERMAFVLGNEGSGVSSEVMDASDEIIKIDMHNIDSLNVAMAGAIVMYQFSNTQ